MDPVALWDFFKSKIRCSTGVHRQTPKTGQNLISLETHEATDVCRVAHLKGSSDMCRSFEHRVQKLLRRDNEQFTLLRLKSVDGLVW